MERLRNVFASHANGKPDAGDRRWSSYRVVITNADGSTSTQTIGQDGVVNIELIAEKTEIVLLNEIFILNRRAACRCSC